ncbi:gluconokinase [Maribacter sp. MMG018]|uniref:gluconokinase n=1 Tax=Maribacter sp. MMG018 TaxID=2822688 RepID=UPI001B39AC3F|nr:gluconokinase [Maribacter sp. MMG018]MBQ4914920.1 gluconokinase [Maribacter sp. MMG018]
MKNKPILYVMGVSGSGKSTIGKLLAETLTIPFFDGDDYHPKANIEKMAGGTPLNDDDRKGWLLTLNELAKSNEPQGAVIVCSALKKSYRELLKNGLDHCRFIYLKGNLEQINRRLQQRKNHFMPANLLQSQFDTLEEPKHAIIVSADLTPEETIQEIIQQL